MIQTPKPQTAERQVLAYFGHHKCASTWIGHILERVASEVGLRLYVVSDWLNPSPTGPLSAAQRWNTTRLSAAQTAEFPRDRLRDRVDAIGADLVACQSADRFQANVLRAARGFHVIRDPRDILVSAYFSHRNTHRTDGLPHLQAHREALKAVSPAEGLLLEMEFSKTELAQIGDWDYANEAILELKTEELTLHPYEGFLQIFRHLGLLSTVEPVRASEQIPVWARRTLNRLSRRRWLRSLGRKMPATGEIVLSAVYSSRFEAQTGGRKPGTEDVGSHYRKGIAGDWVNYFEPQHVEAFNAHFGDLLGRLGYEEDADWGAERRAPDTF